MCQLSKDCEGVSSDSPRKVITMSDASSFICPECHGQLLQQASGYVCVACNRVYPIRSGIHLFTPHGLGSHTMEDIRAWDDPDSGRAEHLEPWRALLTKEPLIRDFEENVLSQFSLTGQFLEVGGGMCWASYLAKNRFPDCVVYASDVAYSALLRAEQLSGLMKLQPDFHLTLDVQSCPFPDDFFDFVFGSATLHHIPDLVKGLSEVRRILKPEGRFIVMQEHALSPLFQMLVRRFNIKGPGKETEKYAMQESLLSLGQFKRAFKQAGFSDVVYSACKNPQYKHLYPKSVIAYYVALSVLPDFVTMNLLGSEIHIVARK